jgi:hypothetical protein
MWFLMLCSCACGSLNCAAAYVVPYVVQLRVWFIILFSCVFLMLCSCICGSLRCAAVCVVPYVVQLHVWFLMFQVVVELQCSVSAVVMVCFTLEDEDNTVPWNIWNCSPTNIVSHPWSPESWNNIFVLLLDLVNCGCSSLILLQQFMDRFLFQLLDHP